MSRARDTADQINRVNSSAADATAITVTSSEKIGIGTDAPTGKLTVRSGVGGGEALTVSSSSSGGNYVTHKHYTASGDIAYTGAGGGAAVSAGSSNDYAIRANLGSLIFATGGNTERMRIDSDGLKFHGDTAAANALNDYEEGTWTPNPTFGNQTTGMTFTTRTGGYTKVGRVVYISGRIVFSNKGSATGVFKIEGLPFTASNLGEGFYGGVYLTYAGNFANASTWSVTQYPVIDTNSSYIYMRYANSSGGADAHYHSDINNNSDLLFQGFYTTDA